MHLSFPDVETEKSSLKKKGCRRVTKHTEGQGDESREDERFFGRHLYVGLEKGGT